MRLDKGETAAAAVPLAFALLIFAVVMLLDSGDSEPRSTWGESAEFSQLMTGQDRFSEHGTNIAYWEVIVDHSTGVQYLYRYKYGVCPLLDADGSPLLVAEAGE